ncbi:hypothetical protein [Nocardioides ganghwensis]|jgi:hypothetical protein|uniref:Uncharacterized protein n=1 Tax=Nocardioides ganghwensis TaxID=252230 RepID=A0A4Q2SCC9_9ACTN|nr:hypothetical protein [Nocardioides ganghwensis]MBD3945593.1 hypothetical protein [Nocardioides ganghwensis]RYB99629.1 hypothetical protein EUA07_15885 [Nocardioides ganghwensis]
MRPTSRLAAAVASAALLLPASPASSDTHHLSDPAGDGLKGRRLDITGVTVANGKGAIRVDVSFVRVAVGDLGVRIQARGTQARDQVVVFGTHRAAGDRAGLLAEGGRQDCSGLRVDWDSDAETASVRLPAACFRAGDYGAVRVRVITEIGSDADLTPESRTGGWPWSRYVARG